VAKKLALSTRTLARRLEDEGESFGSLLDDTRRRLALRHLDQNELSVEEIAFVLGFSQAPVFHRAFRRWTGKTPLEFRRELQAARSSSSE
jgi:AraC-like DNA-binding protein